MRVIVACEVSGVVRRAFRARGHEAYSCDLLPAEDGSPHHYQCDVLDLLMRGWHWDLMIAHPPCTFMANCASKHLYIGKRKENGPDPDRWFEMGAAAAFFRLLWEAQIPRVAVENPIMHGRAKQFIGQQQTQTIQPWQFGHGETKAICLWLRNLPSLMPTDIVSGRRPRVHHESPGPDRWLRRSRTYEGIADAMADQWGSLEVTGA